MSALYREALERRRPRRPLRIDIQPLQYQDEYWDGDDELSSPRQDAATRIGATSFGSLLRAGAFGGIRAIVTVVTATLNILSVILSGLWFVWGRFIIVVLMCSIVMSILKLGNIAIGVISRPPITQHHINFTDAVILAAKMDRRSNVAHFRLLVNEDTPERTIKYATVRFDVRSLEVRESARSQIGVVQIPRLPEGIWNTVEFGLSPNGKKVEVVSTTGRTFPAYGMSIVWHPDKFRFVDLEIRPMPRSNERLQLVYHPDLKTRDNLAVLKYAPFSEYIDGLDHESKTYHRLSVTSVTPKFLGHVTDPGNRVIGFLIEYIWDARPAEKKSNIHNHNHNSNNTRDDNDDDGFSDLALTQCKKTLGILHDHRIAHNSFRTGDCLIRNDESAVLVNFEYAVLDGRYPYPTGLEPMDAFDRDFERIEKLRPKKEKKSLNEFA